MTTGRSLFLAALVALAGLAVCAPGRVVRAPAGTGAAVAEATVNSIGMKLVRIPAGEFDMGSPASEPGHVANEGPVHRVRIDARLRDGRARGDERTSSAPSPRRPPTRRTPSSTSRAASASTSSARR